MEPSACLSLTRGKYAYDFGDTAKLPPLVKMHTLGSAFVHSGFHAGGLCYHGMAPLVSHCVALDLVEPTAYTQLECFEAGVHFARAESIIPAPEANHAVKGAIVEALRCKGEGAVPVRPDMPLDRACLVGCSVMTGVGAVTNTARAEPGSNVVVIGCGGVGLNAVQGAVLAGADRIIAVDLLDNKLEYAREFGATDVVNAGNGDAVARVVELTGGGVDYAIEAIGNPHTIERAYEMCRPGGTTVVVGMAPETDDFKVNALSLPRTERAIIGSWYGSARPWVDLPKLSDLYMSGKLKIDEMISRRYRLDEINTAYDALAAGEVARGVIVFD